MTKDGKENRFGRFIFEDKQAERIAAGDYSAVWEFMEDNGDFLRGWARKFVRNQFYFLPCGFYEADELFNQVAVDFPHYHADCDTAIFKGIFRSFFHIGYGGFLRKRRSASANISLDEPIGISNRSGETESGATIGELLAIREPTPCAVLAQKEHIKEIAPRFFAEIGKICGKNGAEAFRDVIEEVFFGMTFEEVESYAKR